MDHTGEKAIFRVVSAVADTTRAAVVVGAPEGKRWLASLDAAVSALEDWHNQHVAKRGVLFGRVEFVLLSALVVLLPLAAFIALVLR